MQRCQQSGLLPAGSKVQVLQSSILQTDVLQDLSGSLTLGALEPDKTAIGGGLQKGGDDGDALPW